MAIDNTKGEIKYVRGSGPPILAAGGDAVHIDQTVYVLEHGRYQARLPQRAQVIGIDLTRRMVRLQLESGKELLYSANARPHGPDGDFWIFSSAGHAKANAVKFCGDAVRDAEKRADQAIADLERQKETLSIAEAWSDANER